MYVGKGQNFFLGYRYPHLCGRDKKLQRKTKQNFWGEVKQPNTKENEMPGKKEETNKLAKKRKIR